MAGEPFKFGWNAAQRGVLSAFLMLAAGYIGFRAFRNPTTIPNPQPDRPLRDRELADRIDPNVADAPTLAALPGVGLKRAEDIIAFRESFLAENPGGRAFARLEDLLKIRGIGYALMMQMAPYLYFPPTTRPSS